MFNLPSSYKTRFMLNFKPLQIIALHNTVVNIAIHPAIRINRQRCGHKTAQRRGLRQDGGVHVAGEDGRMVVDIVHLDQEVAC